MPWKQRKQIINSQLTREQVHAKLPRHTSIKNIKFLTRPLVISKNGSASTSHFPNLPSSRPRSAYSKGARNGRVWRTAQRRGACTAASAHDAQCLRLHGPFVASGWVGHGNGNVGCPCQAALSPGQADVSVASGFLSKAAVFSDYFLQRLHPARASTASSIQARRSRQPLLPIL